MEYPDNLNCVDVSASNLIAEYLPLILQATLLSVPIVKFTGSLYVQHILGARSEHTLILTVHEPTSLGTT